MVNLDRNQLRRRPNLCIIRYMHYGNCIIEFSTVYLSYFLFFFLSFEHCSVRSRRVVDNDSCWGCWYLSAFINRWPAQMQVVLSAPKRRCGWTRRVESRRNGSSEWRIITSYDVHVVTTERARLSRGEAGRDRERDSWIRWWTSQAPTVSTRSYPAIVAAGHWKLHLVILPQLGWGWGPLWILGPVHRPGVETRSEVLWHTPGCSDYLLKGPVPQDPWVGVTKS